MLKLHLWYDLNSDKQRRKRLMAAISRWKFPCWNINSNTVPTLGCRDLHIMHSLVFIFSHPSFFHPLFLLCSTFFILCSSFVLTCSTSAFITSARISAEVIEGARFITTAFLIRNICLAWSGNDDNDKHKHNYKNNDNVSASQPRWLKVLVSLLLRSWQETFGQETKTMTKIKTNTMTNTMTKTWHLSRGDWRCSFHYNCVPDNKHLIRVIRVKMTMTNTNTITKTMTMTQHLNRGDWRSLFHHYCVPHKKHWTESRNSGILCSSFRSMQFQDSFFLQRNTICAMGNHSMELDQQWAPYKFILKAFLDQDKTIEHHGSIFLDENKLQTSMFR